MVHLSCTERDKSILNPSPWQSVFCKSLFPNVSFQPLPILLQQVSLLTEGQLGLSLLLKA